MTTEAYLSYKLTKSAFGSGELKRTAEEINDVFRYFHATDKKEIY